MSHARRCKAVAGFFAAAMFLFCCSNQSTAQDYRQYLSDGEFSAAITAAEGDSKALEEIANAQIAAGDSDAAIQTLGSILDDTNRAGALRQVFQSPSSGFGGGTVIGGGGGNGFNGFLSGGGAGGTVPNGGGISANDFNQLIQLIQSTVGSDTWEANGGGNGTMFPFPTGVYVDGEGTLHRIPKARQMSMAANDFVDQLHTKTSVHQKSKLRKVSLTRLERALQLRLAQGKAPTEAMHYLAGLSDIRYVMIDPDSGEVIIAGPAGGWKRTDNGTVVSVNDEKPVLLLDDFVVCLRNAFSNKGKFGCAIVPRKENLAATKQYVSTARGSGKKWQKGLQEALGKQDVDVFGIDATTHAARVLVEADHHMKLVGMGIEPSIPAVPGYLRRVELDAQGNPPPMDVVRWWFALNYERIISNEEGTLFEFMGPGVKVLAETELLNDQGDRIHTGKAVGPTLTFARDFTEHFESMSNAYPIYDELKNVFDLAIVANMIREYRLDQKADWGKSLFVGNDEYSYELGRYKPATEVDSVMNKRVIKDRRNGETTIHTLVGVSGGVSFDANSFVNSSSIELEDDVEFTGQLAKAVKDKPEIEIWWWD